MGMLEGNNNNNTPLSVCPLTSLSLSVPPAICTFMSFFTSQPAEARLKVVSAFFEKLFTQFAWIDNIPGTQIPYFANPCQCFLLSGRYTYL